MGEFQSKWGTRKKSLVFYSCRRPLGIRNKFKQKQPKWKSRKVVFKSHTNRKLRHKIVRAAQSDRGCLYCAQWNLHVYTLHIHPSTKWFYVFKRVHSLCRVLIVPVRPQVLFWLCACAPIPVLKSHIKAETFKLWTEQSSVNKLTNATEEHNQKAFSRHTAHATILNSKTCVWIGSERAKKAISESGIVSTIQWLFSPQLKYKVKNHKQKYNKR